MSGPPDEKARSNEHFDVTDEDLTTYEPRIPACPECEAKDALLLATNEYVCQQCETVYDAEL